MHISGDFSEGTPDPRPAMFQRIAALPVAAMTFVPQTNIEDGIPGRMNDTSVSFTYTLIRNPDDRAAPENLADVDADMKAALQELSHRQRPTWIIELMERARYPQLREAVRTSWRSERDEYIPLDALLLDHVNHVLQTQFPVERNGGELLGVMSPAPRVTAAAVQSDAHLMVDGDPLLGIRLNTDPHVYALAAELRSGGILTVVVPRDELEHLNLEFQTYVAGPS